VNAVTSFVDARRKQFVFIVVLALMLSLTVAPSFAQSSISFDANLLIAQVKIWVPIFLPILAIGIAISIAIALVEKVGSSILNAFRK
jgi:hypothetical protein